MADYIELLLKDRLDNLEKLEQTYNKEAVHEAAYLSMILLGLKEFPLGGMTAAQTAVKPAHDGDIDCAALAIDELEDADKYWGFYQKTGDDIFRQIAKQELGHASALIDKGISNAATLDEKNAFPDIKAKLSQMERVII